MATDFAFLQLAPGRYVCGVGPFEAVESPGECEVAFYINDFGLSDPAPWKRPAEWFETSDVRVLLPQNGSTPLPEIEWGGLRNTDFRDIFDDIQGQIGLGTLEKSVPVITERGRIDSGEPTALVKAVQGLPPDFFGYGYTIGEKGKVGATPERLFSLRGNKLHTMALAGTAPKHEAHDFIHDEKEIREHEFVAEYLVERLSELGEVTRGQRAVMDLGPIVHFVSRITVDLEGLGADLDLDHVIAHMHPTPALGAYPRGEGALMRLCEYRERLGTPAEFGAPFGVWRRSESAFDSVVAIRNVSWQGGEMACPSGCGIIRESRFEREWRELALKRNSVKAMLGV